MRRVGVRLQLVSGLLCALLVLGGLATAVRSPLKLETQPSHALKVRLVQLREQGDLKRRLEKQKQVLAATTINPLLAADCTKVACVALTFDDGPNPITTPQILDILEAEHVPATFFVVGSRIPGNEVIVKRAFADGNEIGNHTWGHPNLTTLPADQVKQQVQQTQDVIASLGIPAPKLFRPPYGAVNQTVRDAIAPLTLALWNDDPKDWAAHDPQQVRAASSSTIKPGSVVELHDIYHVTAAALQPLIQDLKARQFQFVTMSQLMRSQPPSSEFYGLYKPG